MSKKFVFIWIVCWFLLETTLFVAYGVVIPNYVKTLIGISQISVISLVGATLWMFASRLIDISEQK